MYPITLRVMTRYVSKISDQLIPYRSTMPGELADTTRGVHVALRECSGYIVPLEVLSSAIK